MKDASWLKAGLLASGIAVLLRIIGAIPILGCLLCPISCLAFFVLPMGAGYLGGQGALAGVKGMLQTGALPFETLTQLGGAEQAVSIPVRLALRRPG